MPNHRYLIVARLFATIAAVAQWVTERSIALVDRTLERFSFWCSLLAPRREAAGGERTRGEGHSEKKNALGSTLE